MTWRKALATVTHNVEGHFDRLRYRFKRRFDRFDPLQILPYDGYGNSRSLHLKGRVLEEKGITPLRELKDNEKIWNNLLDMYRRIESDEIPGARVLAHFNGTQLELKSDREGYFVFDRDLAQPLESPDIWYPVEFELLEPQTKHKKTVRATGHILLPPSTANFGVISDIDDTVIKTSATNLLKMVRIIFLGNARTRVPFKGVAAFYKALQHGKSGQAYNPLFYVSSSPWNLYDLLVDVFELQDIPRGPLLLREYGLSAEGISPAGHKSYKLNHIQTILDTYPQLPFVLIGDSGQKDPEVYHEVVQRYPDRVLAVYIRDVSDRARDKHIQSMVKEMAAVGVDMLLVPDTVAAAEHAAQQGLITESALSVVRADKAVDEQEQSELEKLL